MRPPASKSVPGSVLRWNLLQHEHGLTPSSAKASFKRSRSFSWRASKSSTRESDSGMIHFAGKRSGIQDTQSAARPALVDVLAHFEIVFFSDGQHIAFAGDPNIE